MKITDPPEPDDARAASDEPQPSMFGPFGVAEEAGVRAKFDPAFLSGGFGFNPFRGFL